jgi:hypothetical protein
LTGFFVVQLPSPDGGIVGALLRAAAKSDCRQQVPGSKKNVPKDACFVL